MVLEEPRKAKSSRVSIPRLLISIAVCEAVGGVGSIFTISSIPNWYAALEKPAFTPPNWLFGPIWTTLFLLMGLSLYLLWSRQRQGSAVRLAFLAFSVQLALNFLWSVIFFGYHFIFYGLVEILVLWVAIAFTIVASYRVSKGAAYLLVPYIAWVSIATFLNYSVWILNA